MQLPVMLNLDDLTQEKVDLAFDNPKGAYHYSDPCIIGAIMSNELIDQETMLLQDAADAHGSHSLAPGIYEFRIAREFDPFIRQARMVAD